MLSYLSSCCPCFNDRPYRPVQSSESPPITSRPVNYNSITPESDKKAIITQHKSKLDRSELQGDSKRSVAKVFYESIDKSAWDKEFGETVVRQILNMSDPSYLRVDLTLLCLTSIPDTAGCKRELQEFARDTICKMLIMDPRGSLNFIEKYYNTIDLKNDSVQTSEYDAIKRQLPYLHDEMTNRLDQAVSKQKEKTLLQLK